MNKQQKAEAIKKYGPTFVEHGEDEVLQLLEIDEVSDKDSKEIIAGIKKAIANSFSAPQAETPTQGPKIDRPKEVKKGLKLYDLYKVQKETRQDINDEGVVVKSVFTGMFIKVGKPIKTNIKVEEYRAKILNDQSINSGERLYEVED